MRLTAHDLVVLIDTLNQSMRISNWGGVYTYECRERLRNNIAHILEQMEVEIITDKPSYTLDADTAF